MPDAIAIIATCDTKGEEALYLKQRIESHGLRGIVFDCGIRGEPVHVEPDVSRHRIAEYSGKTIAQMIAAGSRGAAVEMMRDCAHAYVEKMHREGTIQGLIAMGGAEGSVIARAAMDALPLGVPKLTISNHRFRQALLSGPDRIQRCDRDAFGDRYPRAQLDQPERFSTTPSAPSWAWFESNRRPWTHRSSESPSACWERPPNPS